MVLVVLMGGAILLQAALEGFTLLRVVQTSAVLSGLVPYGLFFLIALAYTAGAVASSRRGALVQRVNAVESVSNVDVVCTDKTGTLTTGRLTVAEVLPVGGADAGAVEAALGLDGPQHRRAEPDQRGAGRRACPGSRSPVRDEVPFTSALRWSARADRRRHVGARARRRRWPRRCAGPDLDAEVRARTAQGLRVLRVRPGRRRRRAAARRRRPAGAARARAAGGRGARRRAASRRAGDARPASTRRASRSRCSPATTRTPSPRSPPAPGCADAAPGARRGTLARAVRRRAGRGRRRRPVFGRVAPEQKERIVARAAPAGPLRGHGRRRRQRRPRAEGGAGRRGDAQRQRRHPRRRRHRAGRRLDRRAAAGPPQGRRIINGIATSTQVFLARVATRAWSSSRSRCSGWASPTPPRRAA